MLFIDYFCANQVNCTPYMDPENYPLLKEHCTQNISNIESQIRSLVTATPRDIKESDNTYEPWEEWAPRQLEELLMDYVDTVIHLHKIEVIQAQTEEEKEVIKEYEENG